MLPFHSIRMGLELLVVCHVEKGQFCFIFCTSGMNITPMSIATKTNTYQDLAMLKRHLHQRGLACHRLRH